MLFKRVFLFWGYFFCSVLSAMHVPIGTSYRISYNKKKYFMIQRFEKSVERPRFEVLEPIVESWARRDFPQNGVESYKDLFFTSDTKFKSENLRMYDFEKVSSYGDLYCKLGHKDKQIQFILKEIFEVHDTCEKLERIFERYSEKLVKDRWTIKQPGLVNLMTIEYLTDDEMAEIVDKNNW